MKNGYFKFYKPQSLLMIVLLLGVIIYFSNKLFSSHFGITIISILGGLTFLLGLIDKYLWKSIPFRWCFWVRNFSGRYEGRIDFFNPISKQKEYKKCSMEIFQTGSKIKLFCYFQKMGGNENTKSISLNENIVKKENEPFSLIFNYQNFGNQDSFQPHYGTNILEYFENDQGQFLKGVYFTNREPQTKGDMRLKFISKQYKHEF